jgi:pimeloyl-ACP methyl ester carboxylesterase
MSTLGWKEPTMADERGGVRGWQRLTLEGAAGPIEARWYRADAARAGVVLIGGIGGGFDSPAADLYGRLGRSLPAEGIAVLRVRLRLPGDLEACTADVRAGIAHLVAGGAGACGLVGHSFGGAVVIRAALAEPAVAAVVTLSTQSYGTESVARLRRPLLLVHGVEDSVLPPQASLHVYRRAGPDAELRPLEGAGHGLDESPDEVREIVQGFLVERLRPGEVVAPRP